MDFFDVYDVLHTLSFIESRIFTPDIITLTIIYYYRYY